MKIVLWISKELKTLQKFTKVNFISPEELSFSSSLCDGLEPYAFFSGHTTKFTSLKSLFSEGILKI